MADSSTAILRQQISGGPAVIFSSRVSRGISTEVREALRVAPHGTTEVGGILLGHRSGEQMLVEDFEPVLCEHHFGPFYILSENDLAGFEESAGWFRTAEAGSLEVLGYYRSQTRPEPSYDNRDREVMQRFFAEPGSLFLLLKPGREELTAEPFRLEDGHLSAAGEPAPFPAEGPVSVDLFPPPVPIAPAEEPPAEPFAEPVVERMEAPAAAPSVETRPSLSLPPATRPRRLVADETVEHVQRNWGWIAAVLVLTLAGGVLGYWSVTPHARPAAPPAAPPSRPGVRVSPASTPAAARQDAVDSMRSPVASPETERQIRAALTEWERSVRTGNPDRIADHYAPRLERYFTLRDTTSNEVRRSATQYAARYGRPAILRLSEISILPVSDTRAVVSFRKHWQTNGPKVYAGEDQERLGLVKLDDGWKINSEENTKVYWTERSR